MEIIEKDGRWWTTVVCGHERSYSRKDNARTALRKNTKCPSCSQKDYVNSDEYINSFSGKNHTEDTKKVMKEKALNRVRTPEEIKQAKEQLSRVSFKGSIYEQKVKNLGKEAADFWMDQHRKNLSEKFTGEGNPMYGKPAPSGTGNGWKGWYNGNFFRSLRELQFMLDNPSYVSAETKFWTAEYEDYKGTKRTTRPDFVDFETKTVVECKPKRLHETYSVKLKARAIEDLCDSRGYRYLLVDPGAPSKDTLLDLTDSGSIEWLSDYERKVRDYEE